MEIRIHKRDREIRRFTNESDDRVIYRLITDEGPIEAIGTLSPKGQLPKENFYLAGERKKGQFHWCAVLRDEQEVAVYRKLEGYIRGMGMQKVIPGKMIAEYGYKAAEFVHRNPFLLMKHPSASFDRCDRLWLRFGRPEGSRKRQLLWLLNWMETKGDGSTWYDKSRIQNMMNSKFGRIDPSVLRLGVRAKAIVIRMVGDGMDGTQMVAHAQHAHYERFIAKRIRELNATKSGWPTVAPGMMGPDQVEAVRKATSNNVGCLVGGAGVGKTFALANILVSIGDLNKCCVLAPTGKAAVRANQAISESIEMCGGTTKGSVRASTIHRALYVRPSKMVQYFIIDESSMIDLELMYELFNTIIPDSACVMFVGDSAQLPPVGPGAPFRDLTWLESYGEITQTRRNAGQILQSSHQVRRGEAFDVSQDGEGNLLYMPADDDQLARMVTDAFMHVYKPPSGFGDWKDELQIIAPTNQICTDINHEIRKRIYGEVDGFRFPFNDGDLVINTANGWFIPASTPSMDAITNKAGLIYIANGEKGFVDVAEKARAKIILQNPYREVWQWAKPIESTVGATGTPWRHAYAITVHKSQGSDWPHVICAMSKRGGNTILDRSLIYTALTRAKELCWIYGDLQVAYGAIARNKIDDRVTLLKRCLDKWKPEPKKEWVAS